VQGIRHFVERDSLAELQHEAAGGEPRLVEDGGSFSIDVSVAQWAVLISGGALTATNQSY
jgi:hypothetical protein